MRPIEARIKYKFDTGCFPTYGADPETGYCNYRGGLTHYYAEWLENRGRGVPSIHTRMSYHRRMKYLKNTGNHATYYKREMLYYTKEYKEWLEEEYCRVNTH
jgi:hypothetical protein